MGNIFAWWLCWLKGGSGHRWRRKWGTERETIRNRGAERKSRELHSSLCSLNEVFLLFFRVCMVAFSVDDGCVGIGRVVRSFGFVCQVGSCRRGEKTNPSQGKQILCSPAWCWLPGADSTSEDNISDTTLFMYIVMRSWDSAVNVSKALYRHKLKSINKHAGHFQWRWTKHKKTAMQGIGTNVLALMLNCRHHL